MSILDTITKAEQEAEEKKEQAKVRAREIISESSKEARRISEEKISQRREENRAKLEKFTSNTTQSYASYFDSRQKENEKLAQKARKNLDKAADYIVSKVTGQC